MSSALDLFGLPIVEGRGRGRPRHLPTDEQRARVRELANEGRAQLAIAQALGITVPTLLLNYPNELKSKSLAWRKRALREGRE